MTTKIYVKEVNMKNLKNNKLIFEFLLNHLFIK